MIKGYFTFTIIALVHQSMTSFVSGGANSRSLKRNCGRSMGETSCINDERCAWCTFKYDIYNPICLPKKDLASLPPGYYACTVKEKNPPTNAPSKRRESVPEYFTYNPSSFSVFPSSSPSTVPVAVEEISTSKHPTVSPISNPTVSLISDTTVSPTTGNRTCATLSEETYCLNNACAWCEFNYGMFEPICMEKKYFASLTQGYYSCKILRINDNVPQTNSQAPTGELKNYRSPAVSPSDVVSSLDQSLVPTLIPSKNEVTPSLTASSSDIVSCHYEKDEELCQEKNCKWCKYKYGAYPPLCVQATDVRSIAPLFTCA